ncbi:Crp/Fnr family transcriptional regulator [Algivirga pacifica]|uniref:Crp/Fnr family transcriptional regulator n=1 Tax=Algivirga pacifica TaxID=1162670 RepID=A0ABP9DKZ4_9BACT
MNKQLEAYLRGVNIFSEEEIKAMPNYFKPLKLQKGDYFIREGQVCKKVGFIVSGILRHYYVSSKEEEVTYCLAFPGTLSAAYSSWLTQQKTFESIQAITEVTLWVINKDDFIRLEESSENWLRFSKVLAEGSYLEMEKRMLLLQKETAEKRYEDLINNYPDYLQHIPLKYLASYLGITQRHLSRLRSKKSF